MLFPVIKDPYISSKAFILTAILRNIYINICTGIFMTASDFKRASESKLTLTPG